MTTNPPHRGPSWLSRWINFRKQRVRRCLILLYAGALILSSSLLFHLYPPGMTDFPYFLFVLLIATPFRWFARPYQWRVADERQLSLSNRADRIAYKWMACAAVLSLGLWAMTIGSQSFHFWCPRTRNDFWLIFYVYATWSILLPYMTLAWLEGDLLDDSEERTKPDLPRLQEGASGKEKL